MKRHKPQDALAMAPEEFAQAFELAIVAGERPQDLEATRESDDETVDDDGLPLHLPDTPYNRAGLALKRRYGADRVAFASAFYRFRALMELISRNALGTWVRSSIRHHGALRIHPAVLDVASDMRLSKNGKFAVNKFLSMVEITARERYADLTEWPLTTRRDSPAADSADDDSPSG